MIFILLTFLAAFSIEGLGTYVSVIGLSTLFGANPIIIALAIALDAGKLVVVTLLYSYWGKLGKLMKSYALIAAAITMIITSAGAAGYLSGEFQKAILGTQEGSLKVEVLKKQQAKYEDRKKQIDAQIAALPEKTTVTQRLRLMRGFQAEQKDLQDKITQIDKDLPALQIAQIGVEAKAGPILYISKAFGIPVETAVKWVILMIIFVFDPLAVFLIIAGNFLLHQRRLHKETTAAEADLFSDDTPSVVPAEKAMIASIAPPEPPAQEAIQEVPVAAREPEVQVVVESPAAVEEEPSLSPIEPESAKDSVAPNRDHLRAALDKAIAKIDAISDATQQLKAEIGEREKITLSSLGYIKPDATTQVNAPAEEVGYQTGVFKSR